MKLIYQWQKMKSEKFVLTSGRNGQSDTSRCSIDSGRISLSFECWIWLLFVCILILTVSYRERKACSFPLEDSGGVSRFGCPRSLFALVKTFRSRPECLQGCLLKSLRPLDSCSGLWAWRVLKVDCSLKLLETVYFSSTKNNGIPGF